MAKTFITLAPDLKPDRPRRKVLPILSLFIVASLLAPIIIEGAALCCGQWREMLGSPTEVRTPTLDAIGEQIGAIGEDLGYHLSSRFHRVPWNPRVVLAVALAVMFLAIVMLRL
jgi:hypothetical protein